MRHKDGKLFALHVRHLGAHGSHRPQMAIVDEQSHSSSWIQGNIPIFALLIIANLDTMEFMPYLEKLESKPKMPSCDFWIIGGHHMIEAMRDIMTYPTYANNKNLKAYCEFHEIVIVWSLDKEKLMYISKMLNLKIQDKDAKTSSFKGVTQGWAVREDHNKPLPTKLGGLYKCKFVPINHVFCFFLYIFVHWKGFWCKCICSFPMFDTNV